MGSVVLTQATQGHEEFAGGEDFGGGDDRAPVARRFQGRSGEVDARTGSARWWRCRWCGRGGRGVDDGGAIGGGVFSVAGGKIFKAGERARGEGR